MSDTKLPEEERKTGQETSQSPWDEVIKDFQSLGQSISQAVHDAVQDEKYKESLRELRQGLENVASQVSESIDEAVKSTPTDEVKTGVQKAVDDVKDLGEKIYDDSKPHIVSALQSLSDGLQKMIDRLQAAPSEAQVPETDEEAETETPSTET